MIKAIIRFFRSLRFWVFFVLSVMTFSFVTIVCFVLYNASFHESLNGREEKINSYVKELSDKINSNEYLANSASNADITSEIKSIASYLDGRIIVFDSMLRVIIDTYGIEDGKTLISADAIGALQGKKDKFVDFEGKSVKITMPIQGTRDENALKGGITITYSIEAEFERSENFRTTIDIVLLIVLPVVIIISFLHAIRIAKPFKKVTDSMHHIREGYVEDKVDIYGYTEVENISDEFNEMLSQMSKLENSRQEFVSNVSHELKTPITSIKVLADTLLMQPDAPAEMYQEFLTDINAEIDRENNIITDLLALVKLDRKNGDMHIAQVSINELMDIILKRIKPIALQHNVDLIFESRRDVTADVDSVKLSLAISNLIENGVKYNKDAGWVKVILDSDHKYFTVSVADSGIGIPEESLDKIFDRFYRVDKMRARETGGTGLGLSITKSVVLMHKGTVKVESKEGEGTVFTIRIPLTYITDTEES